MRDDARRFDCIHDYSTLMPSSFVAGCAIRRGALNWHVDGATLGKIAEQYIRNNTCMGISYCLQPLVLLLTFTAVATVIFPETSKEMSMKNIMSLNLAPFRIFELIIGTIMTLVAIVMFGIRTESKIDPWVESLVTYYFNTSLVLFVLEGVYSSIKSRNGRTHECTENGFATSRCEMRRKVGLKKGIWEGGTAGSPKLIKSKVETVICGMEESEREMMGSGMMIERGIAPGIL